MRNKKIKTQQLVDESPKNVIQKNKKRAGQKHEKRLMKQLMIKSKMQIWALRIKNMTQKTKKRS